MCLKVMAAMKNHFFSGSNVLYCRPLLTKELIQHCLIGLSYYLHQWQLIIIEVLWHSHGGNIWKILKVAIDKIFFKITHFKLQPLFPRASELRISTNSPAEFVKHYIFACDGILSIIQNNARTLYWIHFTSMFFMYKSWMRQWSACYKPLPRPDSTACATRHKQW